MRKNTETILLSLWEQDAQMGSLLPTQAVELMTDLTPSGFRSLLYKLQQDELLRVVRTDSSELQISAKGNALIESRFPALQSKWDTWEGQWSYIVFLEPPAGDRQFRRLRKLLISHRALSVSRGVYMLPSLFSKQLQAELELLYSDAVNIVDVTQRQFGNDPVFYSVTTTGSDLYSSYSGASKLAYKLLALKDNKKRLLTKANDQLRTDFSIFHETLSQDPGFYRHYFPGKIGGAEVLKQFQEVLRSL